MLSELTDDLYELPRRGPRRRALLRGVWSPVPVGEEAKASTSGIWWKRALGIFAALAVGWALAVWAPNTEPAQSPDSEPARAPDPAPSEPPPSAAEPATFADRPPEAVPEAEQQPDTGSWQLRTEVSMFDDTKAIYLELPADQELWDASLPLLTLACKENSLQAYVFGIVPQAGRRNDLATARLRFDKTEAKKIRMVRAVRDDALFFRQPIEIVRTMMNHDQLLFGFTSVDSGLLTATFNLTGLREALRPLQEECGWE